MDIPAHARTVHKGLLHKKTGRGSLLNRPSCPPDNSIGQGTELNRTPTVPVTCHVLHLWCISCLPYYVYTIISLMRSFSCLPLPLSRHISTLLCVSVSHYPVIATLFSCLSLSGLLSRLLRPSHSYCPNHCYIFPRLPAPSLKKKIALFIQTTQLLQTVNTIISEWCHTKLCVCGFFLACKDCGGRFQESFPAYSKKKRKKKVFSGVQLAHTYSTVWARISLQWFSKLGQLWKNIR